MSTTFEAIYEDGHLQWLGEQPATGRHRVLVTVLEDSEPRQQRAHVRHVLESTRGAWGKEKTLEEIDAELDQVRAEWERPL